MTAFHSEAAHCLFHVQVIVFISKPLACEECSGHQGNQEPAVSITSPVEEIPPSFLGGLQLCLIPSLSEVFASFSCLASV